MNKHEISARSGNDPASSVSRAAVAARSQNIAPDCSGLNFYSIDHNLRSVLPLYMDAPLLKHLGPYLTELGELAGGRLKRAGRDLRPPPARAPPARPVRSG